MARHSDIRVALGKTFPLNTIGENLNFIKSMMESSYNSNAPDKQTSFMFNGLVFHAKTVANGDISLNDNFIFQVKDLNRAADEFLSLENARGDILYTDLFFEKGKYPETLYFTDLSRASLNAKLYGAAMRRIYNWSRFGSDNPIYINHHAAQRLVATVVIDSISYKDGRPVIGFSIIQNDAIIHVDKLHLPIIIRTESNSNKHNSKLSALNEVKMMINQVKANKCSSITPHMLEKIAVSLLQRQEMKEDLKVTLHTLDPNIVLIGDNDPTLGGVSFREVNLKTRFTRIVSGNRITLSSLITGFSLLRQEYGEEYVSYLDGKINTTPLTADVFKADSFSGQNYYSDILSNIRKCVEKGQYTFSQFDEKGIKVRYVSWKEGKPYYTVECIKDNNVFIFDTYFTLNVLIEEARKQVSVPEPKESLLTRLKRAFGIFA